MTKLQGETPYNPQKDENIKDGLRRKQKMKDRRRKKLVGKYPPV